MPSRRDVLKGAALLAGPWLTQAAARAGTPSSRYTYKDTQILVDLVEDAARLIEAEGEDAFAEFGVKGSRWLNGSTYLFVYSDDGHAAFHPISPELVGPRLVDLRDIDGKPVVEEIIAVARQPARDASGWVFYRWQDQRQLSPIWKSSYIRKAVTPAGKVYLVGSGLYDVKVEKSFIEDRVNLACETLKTEGRTKAFAAFKDSSSPFVFLDTYIFVLDENGNTLVDPAFPTLGGRHMMDFTDFVGQHPIREILEKLKVEDSAWVQYLWPKPGAALPSRKLMFARKVVVDGQALVVGSDLYIATPIWMRVENTPPWSPSQPA